MKKEPIWRWRNVWNGKHARNVQFSGKMNSELAKHLDTKDKDTGTFGKTSA
jgi:hypothetical protein